MIKWYTLKDIAEGYALSTGTLAYMCRTGKLDYMRLHDDRYSSNARGQYLIPESELIKLLDYKLVDREPLFREEHQPSVYLTPRSQEDDHPAKPNYREHLKSEMWQSVRQTALHRDGYTCCACGTGKNLTVHHVNYEHIGTIDEIDDVVTLCSECHNKIHSRDIFSEGVVSIPLKIVDKITDFIFNSAVIHHDANPNQYASWESRRIDELAHYFQFFAKGDVDNNEDDRPEHS